MSNSTACRSPNFASSDGSPGRLPQFRPRRRLHSRRPSPLPEHLNTPAVGPLLPVTLALAPIRDLNPVFDIDGVPHVMLTQAFASVPARELRRAIASLEQHRDQVTRALDILFVGY